MNPPNQSIIFNDAEGRLNISRANNPFITTVGMLDSKDFIAGPKFTRKNQAILKSVEKSRDMYSDYSESLNLEEEVIDEPLDYNQINARNIPCLKSICKKLWKKPVQETYGSNLSTSIMSASLRGSWRNSGSTSSKRVHPRLKESLMVAKKDSFYQKPWSPMVRQTIYLDENNNIIRPNHSRKSSKMQNSSYASGIPRVVFESNGPQQRGIWDESISNMQDLMSYHEDEHLTSPKFFEKRFNSPQVIPEQNRTFMVPNIRRLKKLRKRIKSISPRANMRESRKVQESRYNIVLRLKNNQGCRQNSRMKPHAGKTFTLSTFIINFSVSTNGNFPKHTHKNTGKESGCKRTKDDQAD